jgi:hypothetical protein
MYRKLLTLTATAAIAATALAPAAGAADAAAPKLKVEGAYLYLDHNNASGQDFVRVVFRTASPLPRRADGLIQAVVSIDGISHSIGTATKGAPIYTAASEVKGASIASNDGSGHLIRKGAKIGRTFNVRFFPREGRSVGKRLVLRAERKGDDSGKPLAS